MCSKPDDGHFRELLHGSLRLNLVLTFDESSGNPAVQMVLPMAEMTGWLREGVGELTRQAGL